MKRIIFVATTIDQDLGGIARSVPRLAKAVCRKLGPSALLIAPKAERHTLDDFPKDSLLLCDSMHEVIKRLKEFCEGPDQIEYIYHAGVWSPLNHLVAKLGRRYKVPVIVSTRSMLDPWALGHSSFKKKVAWYAYARRDLRSATAIHSTADMESEHIKGVLGEDAPVFVVPNGVDEPIASSVQKADKKSILFLSRIHLKKGVPDLIEAFGELNPAGWKLMIVGNDDGGHLKACKNLAGKQANRESIEFLGSVEDSAKWQVYRSADLFVLPSYSENFGIVVGEALACGLPVITTKAAPWEGLVEKECGWWVEPGVDSIREALREACGLSSAQLDEMGQRGKVWMEEEYSWSSVGDQFIKATKDILGKVDS